MPELPEVETVRVGLARLIVGKKIATVWYDWPKSFPNAEEDVKQFLVGAAVLEIKRRAKVLLIDLDSNYSLVIHLKMTGQMVYVKEARNSKQETRNKSEIVKNEIPNGLEFQTSNFEFAKSDEIRFGAGHPSDSLINDLPDKSTRVILDFKDGSKLFFNDQRKFGWVKLLPTAEVPNIDFMKKVGPEPLAADFTARQFAERLKRRANTNIKAALLDQSVIAGIGNIYADESLWAAKIHPATLVKNIGQNSLNTLLIHIQEILQLAIDKGGSSNRNYVNAEGNKGSYMDFARVFRRTGQPCPRCGTTIVKTRVAGRGTHTCPKCQKA